MKETDDLSWVAELVTKVASGVGCDLELTKAKAELLEADLNWAGVLDDEPVSGDGSDLELAPELAELLAALEDDGADLEEAKDWVVEFASWTSNEEENKEAEDEELLDLLDGPFKVLRDNTFADPDRLLVWDRQEEPVVQALTFEEATERYPCGGPRSQWAQEDLETLKELKGECFSQSQDSYAQLEADPDYRGVCATPVLVVSPNPLRPHRWCEVKACLDPENEWRKGEQEVY
jgi:hypothetical protein